MNKEKLINLLSEMKAEVEKLVQAIDKTGVLELVGDIFCKTQKNEFRFFLRKDENSPIQYLSDQNGDNFRNLCSKYYAKKLKRAAEIEISQLDECILKLSGRINKRGVDCADIDAVYGNLSEGIRKHVIASSFTDEGYAQSWLAKYKGMTKKDSYHVHKTLRGDYVRSKSEAMIADRLFHEGIPYVYEQASFFDEERFAVLHPDFLVLNEYNRKEYFWEHCGKMDDPKYCNDTIHRLKVFSAQGFVLGKNLIFTYETGEIPIDMDYVDELIREFLQKESA